MDSRESFGDRIMTEHVEIRIPYDDLRYVSVNCSCGTEITIDIATKDKALPMEWEQKALRCTLCTQPFDSQLKAALANLSHWYMLVKDSGAGNRVFFRVKKS